MRDRLDIGGIFHRPPARLRPIGNRGSSETCRSEMVGHHFRLGFHRLREALFQTVGYLQVELLPASPAERFIGGILDQGVLERVRGLGRDAAHIDQLRPDQLVERFQEVAGRATEIWQK